MRATGLIERPVVALLAAAIGVLTPWLAMAAGTVSQACLFNDAHFHLTNYVQTGTDLHQYVDEIMGDKVCRSTVFGIPLQQTWSYENSGDFAPSYYLQTDAPLYYYSFTDAWIATQYLSLKPQDRARLDPMITGFNPADMYGVDHIRRVLQTFPGVFTGVGEFTIHKEFVSSKVAGDTASLADPALDRIFDLCAEAGLIAILHNDIDMPFAKGGTEPIYLAQMKTLLRRHPGATIIWAHVGLGRVVQPLRAPASVGAAERPPNHLDIITGMLDDPSLSHLYFDISWDEVAKYAVATPQSLANTAATLNKYPDRFLFGTDEVAPAEQTRYMKVYYQYDPLWKLLTPEAREKVQKGNYVRLFDAARKKVRTWEAAHALSAGK